MGKAFSENEMSIIRQKLIESCQTCWERHGYRKTTVAEICSMSGISAASLYAFFPSKEFLFVATADHYSNLLLDIFRRSLPEHPTRQDFAEGMKALVRELDKYKWLLSVRDDYEIFLRKLPPDFLKENFDKDLLDFSALIAEAGLIPKVSMEDFTAVVYTLIMSLYFSDAIGERHHAALDILIDSVVPGLFEQERVQHGE